jgi:tRNA modification GTPase
MAPENTYAAILTAPGTSALATIGVMGPRAWEIVGSGFQPHGTRRPALGQEEQHWLGQWTEEGIGDEVVLTLSGTEACQRVELHCHGGRTILRWLLERLAARGAILLTWPEWLAHTAPHRLQAAAAYALTQAATLRTANILLEQSQGILEHRWREILAASPERAVSLLEELLSWSELGLHLTQPWRIVVAGAPNAGKSSLINALLGYQRAITAAVPGTTRDLLTARTALDGWPMELIDTAGLRDATDTLEAQGIARATAAAQEADLVLWLADLTTHILPPAEFVPRLLLLVGNKADQVSVTPPWATCAVSALTGQGVPELLQNLVKVIVPRVPAAGTPVPFTPEMVQSLTTAREAMAQGNLVAAREELSGWLLGKCA